jgi:nitrogen regulatory protein P-II 1
MKKIEAIVRSGKVGAVCEALDAVGHPGVMVTEVEGYGRQQGVEHTFRGKTHKVRFMTKGRIQVVVKDDDVPKTVSAIREAACTGQVGDGKIFIYPVENALRIRTGESGDTAV